MVVPTTRNAGVSREIAELSAIRGFQHFNKHAAWVTMLWHRVSEFVFGQVANIGRIKSSSEICAYFLGHQSVSARSKRHQGADHLANGGVIAWVYGVKSFCI